MPLMPPKSGTFFISVFEGEGLYYTYRISIEAVSTLPSSPPPLK
jgi:hypothetical protein